MTLRTTFRDRPSSRQIALIALPCPKNARRIFAIVSTTSIPYPPPPSLEALWTRSLPGSLLDADHPDNGVLIPRRFTVSVLMNLSGSGPFPGLGQMKPEQPEIDRLRKEVAKLKAERDILKKAAAYFAKEVT